MTRKVVFTRQARDDLDRIFEFYLSQSYSIHGTRIEEEVLRMALETLRFQPGIGRPIRMGPPAVRGVLILKSHWMIYAYNEDVLSIRHIYSGREDVFQKIVLK